MSKPFSETYLGKLRQQVGHRLLQVPGFRAVLVRSDGAVLLQKRADFGVWGLSGGHPEENESMDDCVRREVLEETGLRIGPITMYGFSSDPIFEITTYPNGDVFHSFCVLVFAKEWTGELIQSNSETLELGFFKEGALPEMLPNEQASLESFFRFRRTGILQLH